MRGFLLLLALVIVSGYAAQAQAPTLAPEPAALVGTYRLTYQPDSTNPAKRTDILYLLLGKTLSRFQSRGEQAGDSLLAVFAGVPFNSETGQLLAKQMDYLPHSRFHYSIYKTATAQRLYFYDRINLMHYRYEEPALTWVITLATATVAGYACQRATVAVAAGSGRRGLPAKYPSLPRKVPTSTDRATFRQALAAYNLDPIASMAAPGSGQTFVTSTDGATQEEIQQRARERARKRNNPLELR